MSALVLTGHEQGRLPAAARAAVTAAAGLSQEVDILLVGEACAPAAAEAAALPVRRVLVADDARHRYPLAEHVAPLLAQLGGRYRYLLAPAGSMGKDILPRAAALLDAPMLSDVIRIHDATTFTRPIYAGNALETIACDAPLLLLTIRPTAFAPAEQGGSAAIEPIATPDSGLDATFVREERQASSRPDLGAARVVVSGGRGLGSKEQFQQLETLADTLGAAIGASRAAVDAGYAPNDWQVGQTGRIVAPELYLAVGISGAIQHLAGMKDSKVIAAINKDENAPIFDIADYALVADLHEAVPALLRALE